MDAAGKDGAIRHVMSGVNPQGCQVFSFKHPSATGTRFSVAYHARSAGARTDWHLQPLLLRGSADHPCTPRTAERRSARGSAERRQDILASALSLHHGFGETSPC